jgi:hypothetical protein
MRTISTIVIRLFVDSENPDKLCGSLQSVATDRVLSFMDADSLIVLLQHIAAAMDGNRLPLPECEQPTEQPPP